MCAVIQSDNLSPFKKERQIKQTETNYYQTNMEAKLHLTFIAPSLMATNNTDKQGTSYAFFILQKKDYGR